MKRKSIAAAILIYVSACSPSPDDLRTKAEQGDAVAQYKLCEAYESGEGVNQDYTVAAKWCAKAAEQAHDGLPNLPSRETLTHKITLVICMV